jgi:1-acyl-sn-glycerol-3-phosphate acyltransferase
VSSSVAYFALRTGAPIVPFVFGGTHELFWRRRIIVRILPAIEPPQPAPAPGTTNERAAVSALMVRLRATVEPEVADAHQRAEPPPGARKLARWLTGPYPGPD